MARGDRAAGLRLPVPRLERAHHRRVLRRQCGVAHPGRAGPDRRDRQQLLADQLQLRPDAAVVARGGRAGGVRGDPRRRPRERRAILRSRLGDGAGLQPRDPAARERSATAGHRSRWGIARLRDALRPRAGRHVAAGDRGRRPEPRGPRRGGHPLHRARAAPGRAMAADRRVDVAGPRGVGPRPARAYRCDLPSGRSIDALLLRRADLARGRLRRPPRQRPAVRRAPARARPRRKTASRGSCTSRPTARRTVITIAHGDMALAYALRAIGDSETVAAHQLRASSWRSTRPRPRSRSARTRRGAARTASSGGGATAAARPALTPAGTRPGGRRCATALRLAPRARGAALRAEGGGRPSPIRGGRGTRTSTSCSTGPTESLGRFLPPRRAGRSRPPSGSSA